MVVNGIRERERRKEMIDKRKKQIKEEKREGYYRYFIILSILRSYFTKCSCGAKQSYSTKEASVRVVLARVGTIPTLRKKIRIG